MSTAVRSQTSVKSEEDIRTDLARLTNSFGALKVEWRPDGIFVLTYLKPSREASDEAALTQRWFNETFSGKPTVMQIADVRAGMPPISYNIQKINEVLASYPTGPVLWVATIVAGRDNIFIQGGMSLINRIRNRLKIRTFAGNQYDAAIDWLYTAPKEN